jgi:hypothetical protein
MLQAWKIMKDRWKEVKNNHKLYIVFFFAMLLVIFFSTNRNSPHNAARQSEALSLNVIFIHTYLWHRWFYRHQCACWRHVDIIMRTQKGKWRRVLKSPRSQISWKLSINLHNESIRLHKSSHPIAGKYCHLFKRISLIFNFKWGKEEARREFRVENYDLLWTQSMSSLRFG